MLERKVTVTLEEAREWYNSDNKRLKELALQAFTVREIKVTSFTEIKTFEDALNAINYSASGKTFIRSTITGLSSYSKASAAMFKLNIIRKALNKGYDLHLVKDIKGQDHTWYPYLRFIKGNSTYYDDRLESGEFKVLGKIMSEGVTYKVVGGNAFSSGDNGLGNFCDYSSVGNADPAVGLFGCATESIAKHLGKYFGMLIMEAMYGDMVDFKICEQN